MDLEKLKKLVNEMCDEHDATQHKGKQEPSGGKMARTDLITIAKDAQELVNMFGDDKELDDWVEAKITKAADYLNSVKKYLGGEIVRQHGGLMEQLGPNEKLPSLPSLEELSKRVENIAKLVVTERLLETIHHRRSELGDSFESLYSRSNSIFNELLNIRDELQELSSLNEEYYYITDATYEDGNIVEEDMEFWDDVIVEAEYRGRKVKLNKPTRGDVKKFKVFVRDPKTGNVKKVNFGDKKMRIKKSNPKRRKSFRARHNCDNPGPKTKARYWSCRKW